MIIIFVLVLLVKTKIFRSHHASFDDLVQDWVGTAILGFVLQLGTFSTTLLLIFHILGLLHKTTLRSALASLRYLNLYNQTRDNE